MGEVIDFFPKYTTGVGSAGGTAYVSEAYDVTSYRTLVVEGLLVGMAASGTASLQMEQSSDGEVWSALGSPASLSVGAPSSTSHTNPARLVRAKVTVTGTNSVATLWVRGVARDA